MVALRLKYSNPDQLHPLGVYMNKTNKQTNIEERLQKLFQHILYGSNDVDIQKHSAYYGKAKTEDLCHA